MAGSGGDVVPISARAQQPSGGGRRGRGQKAAWLPLDVVAEIAARSDPATLVRCAATCRDARRRIAQDPNILGRLRLRDTERFVLPLLRGHLTGITTFAGGFNINVDMVDSTGAADPTRLVEATFFTKDDKTLTNVGTMDRRGGLVLVRATTTTTQNNTHQYQKLVCNLATRRCLALLPEPAFPYAGRTTSWSTCGVQYVLLVGGSDDEDAGAEASVGRPFQVLMAQLVMSEHYRSNRRLLVHTFSSEHGAWSRLTEIPTPNLNGSGNPQSWHQKPLVVGDVVHWLCLTDSGSYMLMLHVGAARVNVTSLPATFPRDRRNMEIDKRRRYLLATATAGGNPVVLIADADKIWAWEQSKHTKMWKQRPHLVIENETILGFKDDGLAELVEKERMSRNIIIPTLSWFGERSGVVLLRIHGYLLWLDLQSKKIVRCFSPDRRSQMYSPYEVDLSSWVPTFSSAITL